MTEVSVFPYINNSNRGQEPCKDRDTPDSFVPSSSPESVVGMEISRYPDLSLVKEEPSSPCLSPVLPMLPAPDGKGKDRLLQHNQQNENSYLCDSSHNKLDVFVYAILGTDLQHA